jgi:hypothetical protein
LTDVSGLTAFDQLIQSTTASGLQLSYVGQSVTLVGITALLSSDVLI